MPSLDSPLSFYTLLALSYIYIYSSIHSFIHLSIHHFLVVFIVFLFFFPFLLFPSLVIWWLCLVLCLYSFIFIFCVSVIIFWPMITMRFVHNILCIEQSILGWWLLKFKFILKTLHFLSPPFYIFDLIFYIFLFCILPNCFKIQMVLLFLSFNFLLDL